MKKGILIVSFGTTYRETREKNIEKIAEEIKNAYPDYEIFQAYSSDRVRSVLSKRDGIDIPDIKTALEQMKKEGITEAFLLPTHIIDGVENNKMKQIAAQFQGDFEKLAIAGALLEEEDDYAEAAQALWSGISPMAEGKIVIFMGHGSSHEADSSYERMEHALRECSGEEIYMATVEGSMTIEAVLEKMGAQKRDESKAVLVTPFMLVAGDHAENDMAGEEDSFYSKLKEKGYETECLVKGIGEYSEIRDVYKRRLEKVM